MFGNHTRVFGFANQVFTAARKKPVLFAPLALNIGLAVPVNALLIVVSLFVSDGVAMMLMPVGLTALYFIDYFAGGLNTAMVYDEQSTGNATLGAALKRLGIPVGEVLVSPAYRAQQTARLASLANAKVRDELTLEGTAMTETVTPAQAATRSRSGCSASISGWAGSRRSVS
mgnify:CR=1 FL=1